MTQAAGRNPAEPAVTAPLAEFSAGLKASAVPAHVLDVGKHCLLDWLGVTLAGASEPLSLMLTEQVLAEGGAPQATLVGSGHRVSATQAALVNGATGHALDFDDVLEAMIGHPTVPVLPVLLALAERDGYDGGAVLAAFAAGVETEARIGHLVGSSHYAKGWHATGTIGAFGAAAAAANLMGFDAEATARALGIAGTQAAGLKAMFGTMCKPLHAGKAAQNGLLAAELARRGFTSRPDVLDCAQGFTDTASTTAAPAAAIKDLGQTFHLPKVLFKYHAACYGTHPSIEAARSILRDPAFKADEVDRVEVKVEPACLKMCNIPTPTTGLEAKFSLRHNVGLALTGMADGSLGIYDDDKISQPVVAAMREKVDVIASEALKNFQSEVIVHLKNGAVLRDRADVSVPNEDLADQWSKLVTKFHALADPVIGPARAAEVVARVEGFERETDVGARMALCVAEQKFDA